MSAHAIPYEAFTRHGGADRDWMSNAACRADNPTPENIRHRADLFFPGRTSGRGSENAMRRDTVVAKQICQTCTVTTKCEEYRQRLDINYGVWGGISETERPHGGAA